MRRILGTLALVAATCCGGGAEVPPGDEPDTSLDSIDAAADPDVVLLPVPADQAFLPAAPGGKRWAMTWHDEFDGTLLDTAKWTVYGGTEADPEPHRDGYWVRESVTLDGNGNLVLACYEKGGKYMDGGLGTDGGFAAAFGYFEARVILQKDEGHWFGWWMMPVQPDTAEHGGADGAEIDIVETPWAKTAMKNVNFTIHWDMPAADDKGHRGAHLGELPDPDRTKYHTFGLWWAPDVYVYYIDGVEQWRTNVGGVCQVPEYLILTDEISGTTWVMADKIENAILPDRTLVDYVRVFSLVPAD